MPAAHQQVGRTGVGCRNIFLGECSSRIAIGNKAVVDEDDAVKIPLHTFEVVVNYEDGLVFRRQSLEYFDDALFGFYIHPDKGLVEQVNVGMLAKGPGR